LLYQVVLANFSHIWTTSEVSKKLLQVR